jgi:hypothetical protein
VGELLLGHVSVSHADFFTNVVESLNIALGKKASGAKLTSIAMSDTRRKPIEMFGCRARGKMNLRKLPIRQHIHRVGHGDSHAQEGSYACSNDIEDRCHFDAAMDTAAEAMSPVA